MLKALKLTLKNLDVIAPAIGVSRAQLNHYYETSSYYNKEEYVVVEFGEGRLPNCQMFETLDFMNCFDFVEPESPDTFTEIKHQTP